ncbi:FAD/NAD-P-binding domain-containing protein [Mycena belliarum]|uniref:FAD/NAD-P-binding domain-containing protein n=1 Tax=Mycena belliarum TaxID=1033014 RepID=A0AAD6TWZ6_9AGAR|nr:FAD/NAD-P-binding domain-containing protein [Mycena belliae]
MVTAVTSFGLELERKTARSALYSYSNLKLAPASQLPTTMSKSSGATTTAPGPGPAPYSTGEFAVDDYRPMKVICIGAGFSGILSAIRFRQKVPNLDFKIYEKADGVGGTWRANRYPGAACDVPAHCYQFSFEDQSQWSGVFAPGPEILANIERVVDKYKVRQYIKLEHELTHAKWDAPAGKWTVRIRHAGAEFEESCDVLLLCVGSLSRWRWPEIAGLKEFGGTLVHSAQWDVGNGTWEEGVKDWGDKTVGVIGNGASGIQIVAALHPKVKSLVNYARSKTWISTTFVTGVVNTSLERDAADSNLAFTAEDLQKLKDPRRFKAFRQAVERDMNSHHPVIIRESAAQKWAKQRFRANMIRQTAKKPELLEKILPDWSVFCRRLTPGGGYLEALCSDNATYETTPIKRVTRTGVELADGRHDALDVLVCATGFDVSYHYPFAVVGRGGATLTARWTPHAEAYLALAVDGFPNLFLVYGPGSGLNSASILVLLESQVDYVVKAVRKLQRERLKSMEPKKEATKDWTEHMRAYFPRTVYTDKCNSWYKAPDGTVVGLWPGSGLHAIRALAEPRWEDYEYEALDETRNRLHWLGAGQTESERTGTGDLAWYLDAPDFPPIPKL